MPKLVVVDHGLLATPVGVFLGASASRSGPALPAGDSGPAHKAGLPMIGWRAGAAYQCQCEACLLAILVAAQSP